MRLLVTLTGGLLMLLTALLLYPLPEMPNEGVPGDFLIRNVAIVDVELGVVRENQNLTVHDGRIASIESAPSSPAHQSMTVIDGTGRFLMPGLWDMHTHTTKLASQYQHPLLLANGVTGIRDMWGCMSEPDSFFACIDDRQRWNDDNDNAAGLSPRYVGQSSFQIDGGGEVPETFPGFFKARDRDEARQLVNYYADAGADFLKIYSNISADAYTAIADEARRRGLSLQGHRPLRVSLEAALAADQRSIEHARLFLLECYAGAAEFRALPDPLAAYTPELRARLVDEHDESRCQQLMAAMAESNTWWTPTLQTLQMAARADDPAYRADPRLQYIPYLLQLLMWIPDADRKAADTAAEPGHDTYAKMYGLAQQHVRLAHEAGINLLAGSDTFDTYVFPGFSIHDELAELVASGISPPDALQTATINPAIFNGDQDHFGSIAKGKVADMLLLNANPLIDIRNTKQIHGLFFNGQYFDRSSLDHLLEFAQQRARSIRGSIHLFWAALNSPLLRVQFAD